MRNLELLLDGRPVMLTPTAKRVDGQVLVPVEVFSGVVGAEVKELESGQVAVCKGDLCIPLLETREKNGEIFAPLAGMGEALGLSWEVEGETLRVSMGSGEQIGLGIGQIPPAFSLPDLYTGEPVASPSFRGKKAVFYMWASW